MLFDVLKQLDALTNTLHLVSNVAVPVEPGQKVELKVLSGAPDLFVTDQVLDNPILTGTAQLLTQIPVEIRVKWSVSDGERTLEPGVDFLATNNLQGPAVDFFFKPAFLELGTVRPLVDDSLRIITARVTLVARLNNVAPNAPNTAVPKEVVSKEVKLPLILSLVPLEIPTMLALFRHSDFKSLEDDLTAGFVLMVVPQHSYLQDLTEVMNDLLVRLDEAVRPIRTLVGLAAFLTGLTILRHALAAQPILRIRHGDIGDLDNIHMRVDTRFGLDILKRDLRPDNRASSLVFIAPPGRKVECFASKIFLENGLPPFFPSGAFTVSTGVEMFVVLHNLETNTLNNTPGVEVVVTAGSFNDSISSVKFIQ